MNKNLLLAILRRLHIKKQPTADPKVLGLMGAGAAIILILFAVHIWNTYTSRTVASMLPAEKTVVFFEMKDQKLQPKLNGSEMEKLLTSQPILKLFGVENNQLIPQWAKKNVGVAFIENKPVLFFRSATRRKALSYLKELTVEGEKLQNRGTQDFPIYIYPQGQNLAFAFAGPYLFIAEDSGVLAAIHETFQGKRFSLEQDKDYLKAFSHLPKNNWLQGYINLKTLSISDYPNNGLLTPLKTMASKLSLTVRKKQNGFHFNTFMSLNPDFLRRRYQPDKTSLFTYGLSETIHADGLALYLGGSDLSGEWQSVLSSLTGLNPAYGILLEGALRAQIGRIFGNISLEEDIYPLFKGEYALTVSPADEGPLQVQLILSHTDRETVTAKLKKLFDGFSLLATQFTTQIRTVILPDGTVSREMIAEKDSLKEAQETYQDIDISCIEVKNSVHGFCSAITDELIILTNSLQGMKNTIDASRLRQDSLAEYQPFREALSNLSKVSDEITFIQFDRAAKLLESSQLGSLAIPYLKSLDAATWVKHQFDDGMSTEGYVLIK